MYARSNAFASVGLMGNRNRATLHSCLPGKKDSSVARIAEEEEEEEEEDEEEVVHD
jgi:hypothetical protein